jgi:hypothetical protein
MNIDTAPHSLGRFRPIRILGEGAAGIVYLALDRMLDRLVTIKVILTAGLDAATRAEDLKRLRLEAKAARRCRHPGILAIHDYAEDGGTPFVVIEYVEGPTLRQVLDDGTARPALDPVGITLQILDALDSAHRLQFIHRDIKPANILLTRDGQVKIADFGISRINQVMLTQYGAMTGTPGYMAPEQVCGQPVDHRADLFAVGTVLYEMLAGKPPFQGKTPTETLARLLSPMPAAMGPIPPELAAALQRALAKPPEARFQTAGEFAEALLRAVTPVAAEVAAAELPGAAAETAPPPASSASAGAAAYWGADFLKQLENILAIQLGPIAGVLVRNAAIRTTQPDQLYKTLAAAVTKPAGRAEFERRVEWLRPLLAGPPPSAVAAVESAVPNSIAKPKLELSPEVLQAAQTALAHYLGPIAKVLVRQAAGRASSGPDFYDRLAANLPRPEEAAAFRRKFGLDADRPIRP